MKLDHAMIDIETLGTENDAAILSIGACAFHPDGDVDTHSTFYRCVDLTSQGVGTPGGRRIDPKTLYWWMEQPDGARRGVFNDPNRITLDRALGDLTVWIKYEMVCKFVWSNGSNFDLEILAHAYKSRAMWVPWGYKFTRDTRTRWGLAKTMGWKGRQDTPKDLRHHALGDAIRQAEDIIDATQFIKKGG